MVTALKQCGFDYVFDVNMGADFTVFEEANELKKRIADNGLQVWSIGSPIGKISILPSL